MPIYEYSCQLCQHSFEAFIRSSEDEKKLVCPECKKAEIKKKFSTFGFKSSGKVSSSHSGGNCGSCSSHNCGNCNCH